MALVTSFAGQRIVASDASSGSSSPTCVPSALNRSAVLSGTHLAVSPLPDSLDASLYTQISLLGVPAAQLTHVQVSGSRSGAHSGSLRPYSQGDGASFVLAKPLQGGETVTVRGREGSPARSFAYHFTVAEQSPLPRSPVAIATAVVKPGEAQHFHSRPDLQPPSIAVTTRASPAVAPGYVMSTPYSGPGQDGPMIFDDTGQVVWFDPLPRGTEATNLQVQSYLGHPVLTWWQGYIPAQGFGEGVEVLADAAYHQSVVRAGNGYVADLHDFHLTPQGTALLTVFNPVRCNLSSVRGPREGVVTDGIFQELDMRTGLVRREWHSLDHVAIGDSYAAPSLANAEWPYDYFHINSIDLHADGTVLLSARNTSALYELAAATGVVVARIGGRHSTVKLGPGAATAYQHDATLLPNGQISVFDNGGVPKVHSQSRGLVLSVNPQTGSDTVVAQFLHPTPLSAGSQGNMQGLPGGDFFVGWGPVPYFSEFSPSGQLLFDAHMPTVEQSYRGYRFAWEGFPSEPPAIAVAPASSKSGAAGALDVYASWNGATQVVSWRVLGGSSAKTLAPVAAAPRGGFETTLLTPGAEAYVAVQALDGSGAVLGTSKVIKG
jgi:Arylsulfotransferase (ASST)